MTVQELIDELMKVEDKSKTIVFYALNDETEIPIIDVREYDDSVIIYDY